MANHDSHEQRFNLNAFIQLPEEEQQRQMAEDKKERERQAIRNANYFRRILGTIA